MRKTLKEAIIEEGKVSLEIREQYLKGLDVRAIRNKLEEIGVDRHMILELDYVLYKSKFANELY